MHTHHVSHTPSVPREAQRPAAGKLQSRWEEELHHRSSAQWEQPHGEAGNCARALRPRDCVDALSKEGSGSHQIIYF